MSKNQIEAFALLIVCALLLVGCGAAEPAPKESTLPPPTKAVTLPPPTSKPTITPSETPPTKIPATQPTLEKPTILDILDQLEGLSIEEFFEESYRQLLLRDPDQLFMEGLADEVGLPNDRFTDMSDEYVRETQELESGILDLLRAYDRNTLSPAQQRSYDVYEWYLENQVRGHEFMYYNYPVNSLTIWGKQNWLVDLMVNHFPITDQRSAEDYISRLSHIDTWVDQLLEGLQLREEAGVVPPRYLIKESVDQIERHILLTGPDSYHVKGIELYTSFRDRLDSVDGMTDQEKQNLLDAALREIEDTFIPAFLKLREYLLTLEITAPNASGLYQYPKGQAYYAYMLHHEAGTDLTPEKIHQLGLSEVARIQEEMQEAAVQMGFPENMSMSELQERLSAEGDLLSGDTLLAQFQLLIDEVHQTSASYFDLLPETDLIIRPEPFGSGIGYYQSPPLEGSGPGIFYTNMQMRMPTYLIPSYVYHETVPGHHLQIALARELDLPTFRRALIFNAHAEGWALYAEQLAWEMGLYKDDPLGNLGRLDFELSRAARLVVDTGIHAKGWTRGEAAAYFEEATGRPSHPVAMNRYVVLPGQGCGYTIGRLKMLELRQNAMDQLGDAFDIKEFHNLILSQGSVPLEILEEVVDDWIAEELNE